MMIRPLTLAFTMIIVVSFAATSGCSSTPSSPLVQIVRATGVRSISANSERWSTRRSLPRNTGGPAVGVINGIIYVAGGTEQGYAAPHAVPDALDTLEAYDPLTNKWTAKAHMTTARSFSAAGVINGILYVVGGAYKDTASHAVEAYDPVTNAWTEKAPMPASRYYVAAGVIAA